MFYNNTHTFNIYYMHICRCICVYPYVSICLYMYMRVCLCSAFVQKMTCKKHVLGSWLAIVLPILVGLACHGHFGQNDASNHMHCSGASMFKEKSCSRKEPCAYSAWHSMSLFLIGALSLPKGEPLLQARGCQCHRLEQHLLSSARAFCLQHLWTPRSGSTVLSHHSQVLLPCRCESVMWQLATFATGITVPIWNPSLACVERFARCFAFRWAADPKVSVEHSCWHLILPQMNPFFGCVSLLALLFMPAGLPVKASFRLECGRSQSWCQNSPVTGCWDWCTYM